MMSIHRPRWRWSVRVDIDDCEIWANNITKAWSSDCEAVVVAMISWIHDLITQCPYVSYCPPFQRTGIYPIYTDYVRSVQCSIPASPQRPPMSQITQIIPYQSYPIISHVPCYPSRSTVELPLLHTTPPMFQRHPCAHNLSCRLPRHPAPYVGACVRYRYARRSSP